jgi:hypothetical protein
MKVTRKIIETVDIGDIELEMVCDGKGNPLNVVARHSADRYVEVIASLTPEVWERIARAVRERRREACDWRDVCVEHGLQDLTATKDFRCPVCNPAEEPAPAADELPT